MRPTFPTATTRTPAGSPWRPDLAGVWALDPAAFRALSAGPRASAGSDVAAVVDADRPRRVGRVLVVPVVGVLDKGGGYGGTPTVAVRAAVRNAAANPDVGAILLHVDSPGGTVAGTADLAADVRAAAAAKPVWAHVDDLCASAAYWVASQCGRVYANAPTALVGSIGTFRVVYDLSAAAAKEGVRPLLFATGPLKGAGTPGTKVTDAQRADFQRIVDATQAAFDAAVRRGRNLTLGQLAAVRTGGTFGAAEAFAKRLIDGVQPIDATLAALTAAVPRGR